MMIEIGPALQQTILGVVIAVSIATVLVTLIRKAI